MRRRNSGDLSFVLTECLPQSNDRDPAMPFLIGAAIAATTLMSMALGQIDTGLEALGVLLAAGVLMTLREQ
jgi:hypothetical protein